MSILNQVVLGDNVSDWVSKWNESIKYLDSFNYIFRSDNIDQIDDFTKKPYMFVVSPIVVATRFGDIEYHPGTLLQYVNGVWEDMGLIDTEAIEYFRKDVRISPTLSHTTTLGPRVSSDLIAITYGVTPQHSNASNVEVISLE